MANNPQFAEEKLASLEPQWRPDVALARQRFEVRRAEPRSPGWLGATAATCGLFIVVALALPATRAVARDLWDRLILNRIDVMRLDLSKLPFRSQVTMSLVEQPVADAREAEEKAGFPPDLPSPSVLDSDPQLTVSGPATVEQTVDVHALDAALTAAGAIDIRVPNEWDRVTLRAEVGPIVAAKYPRSGVEILQIRPIELRIPSGFPLERFAEVAFRSIGVAPGEALRMAQEFAVHPAWFFDIPASRPANLQEVTLRSGPAMLVENLDDQGQVELATVIWSTANRTYAVSSPTRDLSMKVAEALP